MLRTKEVPLKIPKLTRSVVNVKQADDSSLVML